MRILSIVSMKSHFQTLFGRGIESRRERKQEIEMYKQFDC